MFSFLSFILFINYLTELYNDFQLMLKILILITIANFARNHLGKGPLSWIIIAGFAFFIFTDLWRLFGTLYVIYLLLVFGLATVLIDFFFLGAFKGGGEASEGIQSPISHGGDLAKRAAMMQMIRKRGRPPIMR